MSLETPEEFRNKLHRIFISHDGTFGGFVKEIKQRDHDIRAILESYARWLPISDDMEVGKRYEFLRAETGHRWFGRKGNDVWFTDGGFYGGEPTHYRSDVNANPPEET